MKAGLHEEVYDSLKKPQKNGKEFLEKLGELLDEHVDWESDPKNTKDKKGKGKDWTVFSKSNTQKKN